MKRHFTFFAILAALLLLPFATHAKNYTVDQVVIRAEVQPDGSILYTEDRTYRFEGSFSQADYILRRRGFDLIRDIQVSEGDQYYTRTDRGREPGTFSIKESNREIEILWNYDARNETRTFTISYVLEGALVVGPEDAEFMWTYLSDRWEKPTQNLKVEFVLPDVPANSPAHWLRGNTDRVSLESTSQGFTLTSTGALNTSRRVIVRSVFSRSLIPNAQTSDPDFTLSAARDQELRREQEAVERAEREAVWAAWGNPIGWILLILGPAIFFVLYLRHGVRHHQGQQKPEFFYAPPTNTPPAVAGKMLHSTGTEACLLTATLFDLARKGYFKLFEAPVKQWSESAKPKYTLVIEHREDAPSQDRLLSFEQNLYEFLMKAMVDGRVSLAALFESSSTSKKQKERNPGLYDTNVTSTQVTKWYMEWTASLGNYVKSLNWYEAESIKWMAVSMVAQGLILAVALVMFIQAQVPVLFVVMLASVVWLITSYAIRRPTPEVQREFDAWKAYRNGLLKGRPQDLKSGDAALHLIYAVALYITGKKFTESVEKIAFKDDGMGWIMFHNVGVFNPAAIANSVAAMTAATTSSFSGGGASAGVAGGGAGGGAR
jgi:uncharacterized membrane protein